MRGSVGRAWQQMAHVDWGACVRWHDFTSRMRADGAGIPTRVRGTLTSGSGCYAQGKWRPGRLVLDEQPDCVRPPRRRRLLRGLYDEARWIKRDMPYL